MTFEIPGLDLLASALGDLVVCTFVFPCLCACGLLISRALALCPVLFLSAPCWAVVSYCVS